MDTPRRFDASGSVAIDGTRFWFRNGVDAAALALGRAARRAIDDQDGDLKHGRRKMLFALDHGGCSYLVKVNRYPFGVRGWLRRSKARREWERAAAARARGIATPSFVAMAEERSASGRLRRCLAVVERIPDAFDLAECWRHARPPWREQRAWARALGVLVRGMHEAGLLQRDLAPNNVLVVPGPTGARFVPIDFERVELLARVDPRDAVATLAKLHRYFYDVPRTLWWRFLLGYSGDDIGAARNLAAAVRSETRTLFGRDVAHLRRTAGRANRRFRPLPGGGWAHREIADTELAATLRDETPERYWRSAVGVFASREALDYWAIAQALAQRGGLIAKPLALVAPSAGPPGEWLLVSRRRSGEDPWPGVKDQEASLRVLSARVRALGLAGPTGAELVCCSEAPGARLRVAPR